MAMLKYRVEAITKIELEIPQREISMQARILGLLINSKSDYFSEQINGNILITVEFDDRKEARKLLKQLSEIPGAEKFLVQL